MITRGGILDPPHGAARKAGDVTVRPELVAGEKDADTEIVELTPRREDAFVRQLEPHGRAGGILFVEQGLLGAHAVAAVRERHEQDRGAQEARQTAADGPAVVARAAVKRGVAVLRVEYVAELRQAKDA